MVYGLYEVSIFLVARVERQREAKLRAEGLWVDDDEDADAEGEAASDEDGEDAHPEDEVR